MIYDQQSVNAYRQYYMSNCSLAKSYLYDLSEYERTVLYRVIDRVSAILSESRVTPAMTIDIETASKIFSAAHHTYNHASDTHYAFDRHSYRCYAYACRIAYQSCVNPVWLVIPNYTDAVKAADENNTTIRMTSESRSLIALVMVNSTPTTEALKQLLSGVSVS